MLSGRFCVNVSALNNPEVYLAKVLEELDFFHIELVAVGQPHVKSLRTQQILEDQLMFSKSDTIRKRLLTLTTRKDFFVF